MRDGVILTNTSDINIVTQVVTHDQQHTVSTLNVLRFTTPDEGNYTCSATNSAGSVISNGIILSEYCNINFTDVIYVAIDNHTVIY